MTPLRVKQVVGTVGNPWILHDTYTINGSLTSAEASKEYLTKYNFKTIPIATWRNIKELIFVTTITSVSLNIPVGQQYVYEYPYIKINLQIMVGSYAYDTYYVGIGQGISEELGKAKTFNRTSTDRIISDVYRSYSRYDIDLNSDNNWTFNDTMYTQNMTCNGSNNISQNSTITFQTRIITANNGSVKAKLSASVKGTAKIYYRLWETLP